MRYRRPVTDGDGFRMNPGYSNFDPVRAGQVIARDDVGPIAVEETSRLLMPLYQEQGEDGYFLVREFDPFWMNVSHALRVMGVSRYAHVLPGVRRVAGTDAEVHVDKRVARFYARQLFHLLGFREVVESGPHLVMRRRPFDEGRYLRSMPAPDSLGAPDGAGGGD